MGIVLKPVSKISGAYGQTAEEEISQLLAEELPDTFLILNSPRVSYQNDIWDIDHVVIGPTGLFVVESKNMNGKITGGLMGNWVQERKVSGRRERVKIGNPSNQVNQYTKIIRQVIRNSYFEQFDATKNIKAKSIVVFAHENSDISKLHYTQPGKVGKVNVIKREELIPLILENTNELYTEEETTRFADILIPPDQRDQTGIYTSLISTVIVESFKSRFELVDEIGRGNFGIVYRAYDTKMEREVAVKKLHVQKKDDDVVNRFIREAKITAKLNHDNIVTFYDYLEEDGECYIVMELVEGKTLEEVVDTENLSLSEVVEIFQGITSALQHAHSNGVVHRDLKPANIIVTKDNKVKIMDFGISRLSNELNITKTNASVGTPNIMSPEQVLGRDIDHRSDLFALGVLLYYLTTGEFPFQGESIGEVVHKIMHDDPIRPSVLNPAITEELEAVVLQALSKDKDDRFQNAEEMGNAISEITGVYNIDLGKRSNLSLWTRTRIVFQTGYWSDILKNEKKRFQVISFITLFAIALLFAVQSYKDSNAVPGNTNPQTNILNPKEQVKHFTNENLDLYFKDPVKYTGTTVDVLGRIIEPLNASMNNGAMAMFRVSVSLKDGSQNNILVAYSGDPHLAYTALGKDVSIKGTFNIATAPEEDSNSYPVILAQNVEPIEFLGKWVAEAENTVTVNNSIDRSGKQLTFEKIEFAGTETRVHVRLKNNTAKPVHFSFKEPKLIQGGVTVKALDTHNQHMEFDLQPGEEASGIIYFPEITNRSNVTFILESNIFGEQPFVFVNVN